MYDVFISYARAGSRTEATALADTLTAEGHTVFLDTRDIAYGSTFPTDLAESLLQSRLMVIFADALYFDKFWCVCEYQLGLAPFRNAAAANAADAEHAAEHLIIALPDTQDLDTVTRHLPPTLAQKSWPHKEDTARLLTVIEERLEAVTTPIGARLESVEDEAVTMLLQGGAMPIGSPIKDAPHYLQALPDSLGKQFVGREDILWSIFNALETNAVTGEATSCVLRGLGGVGKSQIAAEYVWRYGGAYYPGGIFWMHADGDAAQLVEQLHAIAASMNPSIAPLHELGESAQERYQALSNALRDIFRTVDRPVLWVLDDLPEPAPDQAPRPLSYWCPVAPYVRVLGTTRRSMIDAGTRITVSELTPAAAVEMLTHGEVERSGLAHDEWAEIARWVGGLPLALRILHTSLSASFITPQEILRKARGDEPASVLDEEVEALRGEVEEDYLRGVAETFHVSYAMLAEEDEARQGLHVLAFLPPVPLPEPLLTLMLSRRTLGKLGNRSWIQASEDDRALRVWTIHRMVASYIRSLTEDPVRILGTLADWLHTAFESDLEWESLKSSAPHFIRLHRLAQQVLNEQNAETEAILDKLARCGLSVAMYNLAERRADGIRYLAARLVYWTRADDALVDALTVAHAQHDPAVSRHIPHVLQVFADNERAAHLFVRLLQDDDQQVRWKAMVYAGNSSRGDILGVPFLEAILAEPNEAVRSNALVGWANLFTADSPALAAVIPHLLHHLDTGSPVECEVAAQCFGRLFFEFEDNIDTAPFTSLNLTNALIARLLQVPNETAGLELADALGRIDRDDVYYQLLELLASTVEPDDQLRAVKLVARYLRILNAPPAPKITTEYTDEGGLVLRAQDGTFFPSRKQRPELYKPLAHFILTAAHSDIFEQALEVLCQRDLGKLGLVEVVQDLLEAQDYPRVISVARAVMDLIPGFSSPYWWRGQAHEATGHIDQAIADYSMVLSMTPQFVDAHYQRALLYEQQGQFEEAIADLSRVLDAEPENADLYRYRGYLHTKTGSNDDALADFESATRLNPDDGQSAYWQALIHYERDAFELALDALDKVLLLDPSHHEALHLKAVCHLNLGQYAEAIAASTGALRLAKDHPEYLYIRAFARMKAGLNADALHDAQRCLEHAPDDTRCANLLRHLHSLSDTS